MSNNQNTDINNTKMKGQNNNFISLKTEEKFDYFDKVTKELDELKIQRHEEWIKYNNCKDCQKTKNEYIDYYNKNSFH